MPALGNVWFLGLAAKPVSRRDCPKVAGGDARHEREPPVQRVVRNAPRRVRENGPLTARFFRPCRGDIAYGGCDPVAALVPR